MDEHTEFLRQSIPSHDRQIGDLVEQVAKLAQSIEKLVEVSNRDALDIAALARVAQAHEHRLDRIEGSQE